MQIYVPCHSSWGRNEQVPADKQTYYSHQAEPTDVCRTSPDPFHPVGTECNPGQGTFYCKISHNMTLNKHKTVSVKQSANTETNIMRKYSENANVHRVCFTLSILYQYHFKHCNTSLTLALTCIVNTFVRSTGKYLPIASNCFSQM